MSDKKFIFLIESNDFAAIKSNEALALFGFEQSAQVISYANDGDDYIPIKAMKPFRIGKILDQIQSYLQQKSSHIYFFSNGNGRIDIGMGLYYADENSTPVKLTEKEVDILCLLAEKKGQIVSRERLLEKVWQYADNVETHTLETHIYRLRQKIENDPAQPAIILTGDSGYYLRGIVSKRYKK